MLKRNSKEIIKIITSAWRIQRTEDGNGNIYWTNWHIEELVEFTKNRKLEFIERY